MRKILFKDVMTASKILKQTNIKTNLIPIIEKLKTGKKAKTEKEIEAVGIEIMFAVLESAGDAEVQIYKLLDDIFEAEKSVQEMEIIEVIEKIKELAKGNDLISFFKQAGQLTN